MRKFIYISTVALIAIMLYGCNDLLDVTPQSELTDKDFWKSESDLKGACNMLYYDLEGFTIDQRSDEFIGKTANSISSGSRSLQYESSDYSGPYEKIYIANNIIVKSENAPIQTDIRERWRAEAYFFRAYHYFELVKKYGDVPLLLKVFTDLNDPDLKMGRTSREEVIQQCYSDLEYALKHLPAWTDLPTGELDRRRVSRSSALGMIVRIGLYEGTFQKYHKVNGGSNSNTHLKKSIDAFELLKMEGHELFSDFNDVFSYKNEENKEIIFGKAYGLNDFATVTTGHVYTRNLEGSYGLTRNIIDLVLYADGLPIDKTSLKVPTETSYNNVVGLDVDGNPLPNNLGQRDPRLLKTIWTVNDALENDPFMGWTVTGKGKYYPFDSQRPKGYPVKKGFFGSLWEQSVNNKDFTDKIIIRYAEMLLSYAEALYEHNGSISDAQLNATVNAVRARAGFDKELTNNFVSQHGLDMLEEIRRERTVELLSESFRYDDIIRWKIAEKVLPVSLIGPICMENEVQTLATYQALKDRLTDANGNVNGVFHYSMAGACVIEFKNTRKFDPERDYLYYIPTYEIVQSGNNITQNPGW